MLGGCCASYLDSTAPTVAFRIAWCRSSFGPCCIFKGELWAFRVRGGQIIHMLRSADIAREVSLYLRPKYRHPMFETPLGGSE